MKPLHVYKQRNGYDSKKYITDLSQDEAYNEKITEPGQSVSIKQIYERYEKRRKKIS